MKKESVKNFFGKIKEKLSGLIPEKLKKKIPANFFSRFSKKQKIIAIVLAVVIVAGSVFGSIALFGGKEEAKGEITALAQIGSVSSVIEGSGTIEALQQYDITSLIKGEVVADYFEEGDTVQKDDILYRMDDEDGYDAIDNALSSVNKARRSYNNATEDIANLVVKSQTGGTVTNVYVEKGDTVNANAKIADVIDNGNMVLQIQFLEQYASEMISGVSSATVTLTKNGTVLYGTVTKISTGSVISSVGSKVTNVEITVSNPGAIKEGDYATAEVGGYACSSEGTFKNAGKSTIYAKVSGTVEKVHIMVGDTVSYGQNVAILSNENITDIDETRENYTDAQKKYNDAVEGLEDYVVKAPITGTIIQKNIKAGEKLESSNSGSVMAIIADLSALVFEMSVDELDISKLEEGMEVEVTADAIENVTFGAKVTNISIVGTSNNGVTSYPVKITLNSKEEQTGSAYENYDKLIPGLNVSASVVIEKVENVIVVPVSAVRRGNIVIVSEDSDSEGISFDFASGGNSRGGQREISSDGEGFRGSKGSFSDGARPSGGNFSGGRPASDGAAPTGMNQKSENTESKNNSKNSSQNNENSSQANDRLRAMIDSLDIPAGYKAIMVETGLSDESYIEIKQGLSEGDKVLLPDTTESAATTTTNMTGGGMFGGMGGGMPGGMGGGMPGGMQGGNRNNNSGNRNNAGGGMR